MSSRGGWPRQRWSVLTLLTLSVTLVISLLITAITVLDIRRERAIFRDNLERPAVALANGWHDIIADYLYFADVDSLDDFVTQAMDSRVDITYVRVSGADGRILADAAVPTIPSA